MFSLYGKTLFSYLFCYFAEFICHTHLLYISRIHVKWGRSNVYITWTDYVVYCIPYISVSTYASWINPMLVFSDHSFNCWTKVITNKIDLINTHKIYLKQFKIQLVISKILFIYSKSCIYICLLLSLPIPSALSFLLL